jgi:hypothetical protein
MVLATTAPAGIAVLKGELKIREPLKRDDSAQSKNEGI